MAKNTQEKLFEMYNKNKSNYEKNETGSWTQSFVKEFFKNILRLEEKSEYKSYNKNFFIQESKKVTWNEVRADFIVNLSGIKIVVEVEKRNNINPWIEQIRRYMIEEWTPYWILTDSENWYFYNKWFNENNNSKFWSWIYKNINELLTENWENFIKSFFNTKDYYINFFNSIVIESYDFKEENLQKDLKVFHRELIEIAEKLKYDFEKSRIFEWINEKEEIQTIYSFIIQFILIKIIQDKKKILLLRKENFVKLLANESYNELANDIITQINWLWEFYSSYQNEQKYLLEKILKHYSKSWPFWASLDFSAIQWFLDLYVFIYKFNFYNVRQDIFWAVYENYLKELYKEDNSKKWQVFTPWEIVDFMLDEIGYTSEFIKQKIEEHILLVGLEFFKQKLYENEVLANYNIDWISIIDPACWSGTFLYKASSRIVVAIDRLNKEKKYFENDIKLAWILSENLIINNIIGFDIEAFPLYLAEMNILQTLLWFNIDEKTWEILNKIDKTIKIFSTKDTISEFANINWEIEVILENLEKKDWLFSLSEKRSEKDISELKINILNNNLEPVLNKFLVNYVWKQIFHFDENLKKKLAKFEKLEDLKKYISSSQNETLKLTFEKVLKDNKVYISNIESIARKYETKRTKFDFVIWNPPYVQMLKQLESLKNKVDINLFLWNDKLINYWKTHWANLNIFHNFIILGYFLLNSNWKLSFIIPWDFISQISATQIRNFLKQNCFIEKLFWFGDNKIFVDRWLNGKIEVATTSCIVNFCKNFEKKESLFLEYKQNNIETLFDDIKAKKDIFDKKLISQKNLKDNWKMIFSKWWDIFDWDFVILWDFEKENKDLIISKSTEIDKKEKELKTQNTVIDWKDTYNFLEFQDIYKNENELSYFYDISRKPVNKARISPFTMLNSKYKIIWNKINSKSKKLQFCFVDYSVIWHNNGYLWLWSNDFWLAIFIFSLLQSKIWQYILKNVISEQWNTYQLNSSDIREFLLPKIDSKEKEILKQRLIENWEKIISLAKWWEKKLKYEDIFEVEFDWYEKKIVGMKDEYNNQLKQVVANSLTQHTALAVWNTIDYKNFPVSKLGDFVDVDMLQCNISTIEDLEKERNDIVKKLYEM